MNKRVPWKQYEVVLLIDAYMSVVNGLTSRYQAVCSLSNLLRKIGRNNGIKVDEIYRNPNGISMRMAEIERLFNGAGGLKNTSKLFAETVELFKNDRYQFDKILQEAKKMTDSFNQSNREAFLAWLRLQNNLKAIPDVIIIVFDEASTYASSHKITKTTLWEIEDVKAFDSMCRKLLSSHLFRVLHKKTAIDFEKFYRYYRVFLTNKSQEQQIPSSDTILEKPSATSVIHSETEGHSDVTPSVDMLTSEQSLSVTPVSKEETPTETQDKHITIIEAVSIVLQKASKPLSAREIYDQIVNEALYTFGAQDPVHVVDVKINTACRGSNHTYRAPQDIFGFIRENGEKRYFLLSKEKELLCVSEPQKDMQTPSSPYVRTDADAKLLEKYPVIFKRIYATLKDYGNIRVSARDVLDKLGGIARLSTVKHILEYASWCEHTGGYYRYSETPIPYVLPDNQTEDHPTLSRENDFYHWLETSKKLSASDCSRYTSGIHVLSRFLKNECSIEADFYRIQDSTKLAEFYTIIKKHPSFVNLSENQRERLTSSMKLYEDFLRELEGIKVKEVSTAAKAKEREFRQWAALHIGPEKAGRYADALKFIEDRCIENKLIDKPFYELDKDFDFSLLLSCVQTKKFPFILHSANLFDAIEAIPFYKEFLQKDNKASKKTTSSKDVKIINFKEIGDLSFTKPIHLRYRERESTNFDGWSDLYAKLLFMLRVDHPRIIADGTFLSGGTTPDISSDKSKMRSPKTIGRNLYVETNQDSKGLVKRIKEALRICGVSTRHVEIQYIVLERTVVSGDSKQIAVDSQKMSKLMTLLKTSENGISLDEIKAKFPDTRPGVLKAMLNSENAIMINKKYYHKSNIEDFEDAADIILSTLKSQFKREGGYTSAKMLYDELHVRLEDFFFDNGGFDSQVELYDLTYHLFEKIKYKGNHFIFADNKHIWESEPDYPKTYLGILSHWARSQNGLMTRDEFIERLINLGAGSPQATFSWLMLAEGQNPKEKVFLIYDENRLVLTEYCQIDEDFLASLRMRLEELLDGDDYLPLDDIDQYFYTTLPELPAGVFWTVHMLKSVLAFFDVGFATVAVGGNNDIKVPDAAIIRKNSAYKTFSDVLWSEINHDYELPREFSAEEFRQILLRKGFIHGTEKLYSVHTTVEGDLRFFWTDNNNRVTVSKK